MEPGCVCVFWGVCYGSVATSVTCTTAYFKVSFRSVSPKYPKSRPQISTLTQFSESPPAARGWVFLVTAVQNGEHLPSKRRILVNPYPIPPHPHPTSSSTHLAAQVRLGSLLG